MWLNRGMLCVACHSLVTNQLRFKGGVPVTGNFQREASLGSK